MTGGYIQCYCPRCTRPSSVSLLSRLSRLSLSPSALCVTRHRMSTLAHLLAASNNRPVQWSGAYSSQNDCRSSSPFLCACAFLPLPLCLSSSLLFSPLPFSGCEVRCEHKVAATASKFTANLVALQSTFRLSLSLLFIHRRRERERERSARAKQRTTQRQRVTICCKCTPEPSGSQMAFPASSRTHTLALALALALATVIYFRLSRLVDCFVI